MFVVIFEVLPAPGRQEAYLALAASLRGALEGIAGFRSVERFAALARPGWLLSLSFWETEAALIAWREQGDHKAAQTRGRQEIFADYRLRVGRIAAAPGLRSLGLLMAEAGADLAPKGEVPSGEVFESLSRPGHRAGLYPAAMAAPLGGRVVEVLRDYGPKMRAEAPPRRSAG